MIQSDSGNFLFVQAKKQADTLGESWNSGEVFFAVW